MHASPVPAHPAPAEHPAPTGALRRRRGLVRLAGQRVGVLEETDDGTCFTYDAEWLARSGSVPFSLTLPLREEAYASKGLHPFFENLLPEGWLLEIATAKLKISKDDAFGLLLATCADCVGAVEVVRAESVESAESAESAVSEAAP